MSKSFALFLMCALTALLATGCEVKGTVTDVATGEPIAGVSVGVDDGFEAGVVPLSPVAPEIVVEDYVASGIYYVIGYMEGTLELSESGDRITGSNTIIEGVGINSYECTIEGEFDSDRVDTYYTF